MYAFKLRWYHFRIGIHDVILWENSVRFITLLKRCGNVCVCVWGGGGLEGFWLHGPGEYLKIWQITGVFHKYTVFMQHTKVA